MDKKTAIIILAIILVLGIIFLLTKTELTGNIVKAFNLNEKQRYLKANAEYQCKMLDGVGLDFFVDTTFKRIAEKYGFEENELKDLKQKYSTEDFQNQIIDQMKGICPRELSEYQLKQTIQNL